MTAQVGDRFIVKGDSYSIVAISNPILFQPQDYGIVPAAICTACWNGYWCEYLISEQGIMLKNLYIHSQNNYYPAINGVEVKNKGNEKRDYFLYMGHNLYENINLFLEYTGKILMGKGFLNQYYIHMGYQRAWAYETLKELVFENGKLAEMVDHSEIARKLRDKIEKEQENKIEKKEINKVKNAKEITNRIRTFVEESFSLEIKDKAWWID